MQKIKGIKWGLLAAMLVLVLGLTAACANRANMERGTRVIEGYIVDFDGNRVTVNQVELLTASNTSRINDLGLDANRDFRDGYYIHDESRTDRKTYTLAKNVQVRFADSGNNQGANVNVNMGVDSTLPKADVGMVNPVMHAGYTLGGTATGTLGGVEMLNTRFRDGVTVNSQIPYFITIKDGYVTNIEEVRAFSNFGGNGYVNTNNYPNTNTNTDNYPNNNTNTNYYPNTNTVIP